MDFRDVAEVAAIALLEDRLLFGTFELCAEGHFNRRDIAALMSDVLGRKIEASRPPMEQPASQNPDQNPDDAKQAAQMTAMFDWYDHHGLMGNALILRAILGREPRTLRAYLEELAAQTHAAA